MSGPLGFYGCFWPVAKLERHVTVTHAMRRFESCPASQILKCKHGSLVQWEERGSHKAVADGSNPSRATMEGPPARGSGLYPLRRQISAARQVRLLHPLPSFRAGSSTDQNSWPTPNRCGFNSRTAHQGRISSKVEPAVDNREALVRFQHPAPL